MKVLNLQCAQRHAFEGWFASEEDFQDQLARAFIECPMCADKAIVKMPSAPRLNLGAAPREAAAANAQAQVAPQGTPPVPRAGLQSQQAATVQPTPTPADFLSAVREFVARSEDVGERFAEEARRMHYGETKSRGIRGQASLREAAELVEEGIDVLSLPHLPAVH